MQEEKIIDSEIEACTHYLEKVQSGETFGEEVEYYRTLGQSLNLALLKVLEYRPMSAQSLSKIFRLKEPLIAQNLKNLEKIGVIISEEKANIIIYRKKK